jgi:hypothetical protein
MKKLIAILFVMTSLSSFAQTICNVSLLSSSNSNEVIATKVFDVAISVGGCFGAFYEETESSRLEICGVINDRFNAEFDISRIVNDNTAAIQEIVSVKYNGSNFSKIIKIDNTDYNLMTSCASL